MGRVRLRVENAPTIEMRSITKRYGPTVANDAIDLTLRTGEIHVLLGENGAGKTTLMSVLFGMVPADSGEIRLDGVTVSFRSPRDALDYGIGMVHQRFMLLPDLSIAENVVLGSESSFNMRFRQNEIDAEVASIANQFGLQVDPREPVGKLSIDLQQRVEILKLLFRGATVLIFDEPTSSLGPREIARLFSTLRTLRDSGHTLVVITHKLSEAAEIADRVTVLRRGRVVITVERGGFGEADLARAMVGADVTEFVARTTDTFTTDGDPIIAAQELVILGDHGEHAVDGVTFSVRPGEILGVAGVEGNGQRELGEALAGLRRAKEGRILIAGDDLTAATPRELHRRGISVITEDRTRWDVVLDFSLEENLALARVAGGYYTRHGFLDLRAIRKDAEELLHAYGVQPPEPAFPARSLSGGNQQKLVVARELSRQPRCLIAAQPTRGIDFAATQFVHRELSRLRDQGCAIVLISLDLDELMGLADRVLVLFRGRVAYDRPSAEVTIEAVANAMAGVAEAGEQGSA